MKSKREKIAYISRNMDGVRVTRNMCQYQCQERKNYNRILGKCGYSFYVVGTWYIPTACPHCGLRTKDFEQESVYQP